MCLLGDEMDVVNKEDRITQRHLSEALAARYCAPAWAFLPQVRNGTGWSRAVNRTADAVAMSLWPSRGLEFHGFEIKVHRGDWFKELREPAKAEEIQRFCDRWWIVAGDESIVQAGELPPTWGLLVLKGKGLTVKVEAPKLEAAPADRSFLAAILRRVGESTCPMFAVDARVEERVTKAKEQWDDALKYEREGHDRLAKQVAGFEKASGLKIQYGYRDAADLGAAVRYVLDHGPDEVRRSMEAPRASAQRIVDAVSKELDGELS